MNKIFLTLFIVLAAPIAAFCQPGIKAGFNLSYANGENDLISNRSSRIGFQGGFMYRIGVKDDWLSVQPELIYIQKGGTFNIDQLNITAKWDYIELPVLCVFNVLGGVINFHAGPQFSYLINVDYTVAQENGSTNTFKDTDLNNYNLFDIGLLGGVGVEFEVVMVEIRYSIGFIAVEKGFEYDGQMYNPSSKNFNAQFIASYFF